MEFRLNTCIYEFEKDLLHENIKNESMKNLGFNCVFLEGDSDCLFKYLSENKVDILVVNSKGFEVERFSYILDIVHANFCKEILVLGEDRDILGDYVKFMSDDNFSNLDLKIQTELLKIKRETLCLFQCRSLVDY